MMQEFEITAARPGELAMSGALTVTNASAILQRIRDALVKTDNLIVTVGEDVEVDVSFLQLLCSAHRTALIQNKRFNVNTKKEGTFASIAAAAGFIRSEGCSGDHDSSCLWAGGGE